MDGGLVELGGESSHAKTGLTGASRQLTSRESLLQHTGPQLVCLLTAIKTTKKSTLEQKATKCKHSRSNIMQRDVAFCVLFVKLDILAHLNTRDNHNRVVDTLQPGFSNYF